MKGNSYERNRRSIRLKDYDYTTPGAYFVTICSLHRRSIFGEIRDGVMSVNPTGQIIEIVWREIPTKFPSIYLDAFVVMPNHVHFILQLTREESDTFSNNEKDFSASPYHGQEELSIPTSEHVERSDRPSLSKVMQWYKSLTTAKYRQGVKSAGWLKYSGRLWQRNYYEHIVRNERELHAIREYLVNNPLNWLEDQDHPDNFNKNR